MSKSREQLNNWLKEVDITGKVVLDVGVQDKPTSRLTKGKPKKYETLDIDGKWSPDILLDLNSGMDSYDESLRDKYDVIFCIEVLEHTWDPINVLKFFYRSLKRGGELYISTPFINPHHDTHDYLRYTNEWFAKVLAGAYDIEYIRERVATNGLPFLKEFYRSEGLRVSKIRPEYGKYTYPIGYFVKAVKK